DHGNPRELPVWSRFGLLRHLFKLAAPLVRVVLRGQPRQIVGRGETWNRHRFHALGTLALAAGKVVRNLKLKSTRASEFDGHERFRFFGFGTDLPPQESAGATSQAWNAILQSEFSYQCTKRRLLIAGRMRPTTERRYCGLLTMASPVPRSGQRAQ